MFLIQHLNAEFCSQVQVKSQAIILIPLLLFGLDMPHELCCSFVYWSLKCDCAHCVAWICVLCVLGEELTLKEKKKKHIIACLMQYELSHFAKDVANVSQEIPRILNIMTWSMHGFNFYCIMLREL